MEDTVEENGNWFLEENGYGLNDNMVKSKIILIMIIPILVIGMKV